MKEVHLVMRHGPAGSIEVVSAYEALHDAEHEAAANLLERVQTMEVRPSSKRAVVPDDTVGTDQPAGH